MTFDSRIRCAIGVLYFEPQDCARAEAMVRAMVPEGIEAEFKHELIDPESDVMRQAVGLHGAAWRWPQS